ncbi:Ni/Fe hydrogenase subunit alpha [Telluria beijingensis]|uniref:Ni/Fe hydrogenase subunit alpha n=1 Tax=Telluria beijingensis TaxID=3068633 RepID=UPI0027952CDE|nr:nickel-dependent hydrogenase large subunit [Massilia sp. REN29]
MNDKRTVGIRVPVLARVEGEGALEIDIADGRIASLRLRIYEPPRLFEKFLQGRAWHEVPDMVARICGICPVAYQMSAVHALERIFGIDPGPWVRAMRRVMYCGEWIESHCLHIHLLAAPDFLGCSSVIELAQDHPDQVRRGLALQALGNDLIRLLGARSVHPVGVRVGGFHHAPAPQAAAALCQRLREALPEAQALLAWTAALPLPDSAQQFPSVALHHPHEYPMNEGRIVSSQGLDIGADDYESRFAEHQVPHSTALHSLLQGQAYLVGPLARVNLNHHLLPEPVRAGLAAAGIPFPSSNVFHSIVARAAEVWCALLEALRLLEQYRLPDAPWAEIIPRAGIGMACTEAPRGILWHRYETDGDGIIRRARIVPPTSQNQARIEQDLLQSLEDFGLDRPDDELRRRGETVIRNYDPCISCATHFLTLAVRRR